MADVEVTREQELSRQEAAERLRAFAAALEDGGAVEIDLGGSKVKMHVPEIVRAELEIEIDGNEVELEIELKWSTGTTTRQRAGRRRSKPATPAAE
jgi:amphi-Trp domain-containing protein